LFRRTFAGPQSSTGSYKPSTDPGVRTASSAAGSPANFYSQQNTELKQDISKGAALKHVETQDKSVPKIEQGTQVKKVDRKPFIHEVQSDHELKPVEAASDRSAPHIEEDVHLKKTDRAGFLHSVEEAAREKGTTD